MDMTVKASVRYDGTAFAGWQIQPDTRTVQGDIERALSRIFSKGIRVQSAARTDAGVHAFGQVISFQVEATADLRRLRRSLNSMLRPEIRFEAMETAPSGFSARFDARWKTYVYTLELAGTPDPFSSRYAWSIRWNVDLQRAERAARRLSGRHDFAGFQCAGGSTATTIRTLYRVALSAGPAVGAVDSGGHWRLEFTGDGFLYKMVRNMTGMLIDIGRGHVPESRIGELLSSPGPYEGHTAPAHGLALLRVGYAELEEEK